MDTKSMLARIFTPGRTVLVAVGLFTIALPALGGADGLPRLDPTNGNEGTLFTFTMNGDSSSMDPALQGGIISWNGGMRLYQDVGSADFQADMDLDTNKDGIPDRTLDCDGTIGNRRISMRCVRNDGNGELRFLVTGRAVILDSGKLAVRRTGGRGFTDTHTFSVSFQATQVVP